MFNTMLRSVKTIRSIVFLLLIVNLSGCKKIDKWTDENPDITPLQQGFKTSAAIGYCVSLAATVLQGGSIPENVQLANTNQGDHSSSGFLYVTVDDNHPLPFNSQIGDIVIAGIMDTDNIGNKNSGVISIVFADLNVIGSKFKFYGIYTVPFVQNIETGKIMTVFAKQDIVLGEGSDTLLNLSMSNPQFNMELLRLNEEQPSDVYAAVSQNVWFISIDQNQTSNLYDDSFVINGGGQIAEVTSTSGGIQYHAMIETEFIYDQCSENPLRGDAFMQNLKAGTGVELGNILLNFHDRCDGKAYVEISSGEWFNYVGRHVNLNFN